MLRTIAAILNYPTYLLDERMGARYLNEVASRGGENGLPVGLPSAAKRTDSWVTNYVKTNGHAHYFINPDNAIVHSLDDNAYTKIKPGAIAVVPVYGMLVKEANPLEETYWGLTSTERLKVVFQQLAQDDRIAATVQTIYSPGGQVHGTEAYGDAVLAFAEQKPLIAHIDQIAASGGYWAACQSDTILLDGKTSEVGSIGVMVAWLDLIPLYESMGAKMRMFFAPESSKKNEEIREIREKDTGKLLEKSMSRTAQVFIGTVQAARGTKLNTGDEAILQGRMYQGVDAITSGLADGLGSLEDAIQLARDKASINATAIQTQTNNKKMSIKKQLKAISALFTGKDEVSAEDLAEANASLVESEISNVVLVSTEEKKRLDAADTAIKAADAKAEASAKAATDATAKVAELQKQLDEKAEAADATDKKVAEALKGTEASEGKEMSAVEQLIASNTKLTEKLNTVMEQVTKLNAEQATDGKPEGVVAEGGDTNDHGTEVLSAEEKEFRNAKLG